MEIKREKPTKGQILYSLESGNAVRRGEEPELTPVVVTSVGRKYFYTRPVDKSESCREDQYYLSTWREVFTLGFPSSVLYTTKEEYEEEVEAQKLCKQLCGIFEYPISGKGVPLQVLKGIKHILDGGKTIPQWCQEIHRNAVEKGFYEDDRQVPEMLCLVHSEVSEALEDYRKGIMVSEIEPDTGKPIGLPSELADIIIRVLDMAGHLGIDIEKEILDKTEFNRTRPHKHGKKI